MTMIQRLAFAMLATATIPHILGTPAYGAEIAASGAISEQHDRFTVERIGDSGPDVILIPGLATPREVYAGLADALRGTARQARAQGKKLIIDLGGNWCADCRILAGVLKLPEVKTFVNKHYVVAMVNVGRFDKNAQVARPYGITSLKGVPALMIVDPKTNKLINGAALFALADARSMTPQALADWLAKWVGA